MPHISLISFPILSSCNEAQVGGNLTDALLSSDTGRSLQVHFQQKRFCLNYVIWNIVSIGFAAACLLQFHTFTFQESCYHTNSNTWQIQQPCKVSVKRVIDYRVYWSQTTYTLYSQLCFKVFLFHVKNTLCHGIVTFILIQFPVFRYVAHSCMLLFVLLLS